MKVSLNTVKQYTDIDLPVDELVTKINQQLGGVEAVIDLATKYQDALIVRVVECDKHPNADRLNVTKVDDGGVVKDVPRDANGLVQVVCGAPNVHADMLAVWLPPKSTVPASSDDAEPFVLDARELRGVLSQGMLAAPDELAIGSDHDGILVIEPSEWKPNDVELKPGASFAAAYGLDDVIIDIENKMFTHRPDLFGQLGVAREIAGIQHQAFSSPDWYQDQPQFKAADGLDLVVSNQAIDQVPRFMAVAIGDVEIKPSPLWLRCELVRLGAKPINNVVDVTNYVMLLTAQPVHAYDYDKLHGAQLGVRRAKAGEQVSLLNHKTYKLDADDIVIVDGNGPVGLAGIMGGGDSEVSDQTKNLVLEVATFDMYAVRKSSMRHGVFTDALARFNKGQSPWQNDRVLSLLMQSILDVAGGHQASPVFDESAELSPAKPVDVSADFINRRLGLKLTDNDIKHLLTNVEIKVADSLEIQAPFWRTDIELKEDIVEEVGRLYGFDKLPRQLPNRSMKPARPDALMSLKSAIRQQLAEAGANEVLTYSFVHGNLIDRSGQDRSHAFELTNALSPDLQYYRLSLMPSLLSKVHMNLKAGYDRLALFELGKAHIVGAVDESGLPREDELTALVVAFDDKLQSAGAAFYQAKRYLEALAQTQLDYRPIPETFEQFDIVKPYQPGRSSAVYAGDKFLGLIGEFRAEVRKALKLPQYSAGFELDTAALAGLVGNINYRPLSKFPGTARDLTLLVGEETDYAEVAKVIASSLADSQLLSEFKLINIYRAEAADVKNLTFRVYLTNPTKTITTDEANHVVDKIVEQAKAQLKAEVA